MRPKLTIDRLEIYLLLAATIILAIGLLLNLGVQPLYLEEPRRCMIAMEMLENGNWLVPTELGDFYYKKPPVYNWMLMISALSFGGFSELALRLPTVLSAVAVSVLMFFLGRKYVDWRFGWITALLFPLSGGILFYFSILAEIDLFYSFVTVCRVPAHSPLSPEGTVFLVIFLDLSYWSGRYLD